MPTGYFKHSLPAANGIKPCPPRPLGLIATLMIMPAVIAAGCGQTAIDASSPGNMQESIEIIRTGLDDTARAAFDTALEDLSYMLFNQTDAVSQATISRYRPEALLRKILHGKTSRDVIRMVEEYRQRHMPEP